METREILKEKTLRTLKRIIRKHKEEKGLSTKEMIKNSGKTRQEVERLTNPNDQTNCTVWSALSVLLTNDIDPFPELMQELKKEFKHGHNDND